MSHIIKGQWTCAPDIKVSWVINIVFIENVIDVKESLKKKKKKSRSTNFICQ